MLEIISKMNNAVLISIFHGEAMYLSDEYVYSIQKERKEEVKSKYKYGR